MAKYKVYNDNIFNVGIKFENDKGREVLIRGKKDKNSHPTFVSLDEDDIQYINSVSRLFSNGVIYVKEQEILEKMGFVEENPNAISNEEITKILKAPNPKLKKEIKDITSQHAIDKVVDLAKDLDLPTSKIKILQDQFGKDIFEELDDKIV